MEGIDSLLTQKQQEYLTTPMHRINLLYGSVRSGKTYISLIQWAFFVASRPLSEEFIMIGRTVTTLKRNCLNLLQDLVGEDKFTYSISNKEARLFGRTVWLEGADNERAESKIRGMTLAGGYVDEVTMIPRSMTFMLFSRLSVAGAVFLGTTNPDSPESYVNQEIILNPNIDKQVEKFTMDDNTFLDPVYVQSLKNEYASSPVMYQRFILGNFVRAEGVIFNQFADHPEKWILKDVPKDVQWMTFGIDFGVHKSKTIFICTGIRARGAGVVILEEKQMDCTGVAPDLIEKEFVKFVKYCREKYPSIKMTYCWTDQPETLTHGIHAAIKRAGIPLGVSIAKKEQIKVRIFAKIRMLNLGKWNVMEHCKMVIFSTANQVWDEKKGDKGVDERLDNDPRVNDVADAEEYSWEPFIDDMDVRE